MRQTFHVPCHPPTRVLDQDARRLGVYPPSLQVRFVAPCVFVDHCIGLGPHYLSQRDELEGPALPAAAWASVLLFPLQEINGLANVAAATVEEQCIKMPGAREIFLIAFPAHGYSCMCGSLNT